MSDRPMSLRPRLIWGAVVVFTAMVTNACVTQAEPAGESPAPSVGVVVADERDVPLETPFMGRVEAVHTVDLRPRVGGALDKVLFREGAIVRRGAPLFQLDQRPYAIALRQAEAETASVNAQFTRAQEELRRAERLAVADAVSIEELERRRAEVVALEARLEGARAAEEDASLRLEFTTVHAPVDGRIGRAEVTAGNLVDGGPDSGTRLAVLHSVDPIFVYFELDPATAAAALRAPRDGWRATVSAMDAEGALTGPIDFIDNGVGAQSGTLKIRARLTNPGGRLFPGSVVKVAFRYGTAERATVVPERAIGTDQGARYLLVAGSDGTVQYRPISLGARSGEWRAVDQGVRAGEQVILPGLPGLRPGIKVNAVVEVAR